MIQIRVEVLDDGISDDSVKVYPILPGKEMMDEMAQLEYPIQLAPYSMPKYFKVKFIKFDFVL